MKVCEKHPGAGRYKNGKGQCKGCHREYHRRWRLTNAERYREVSRAWVKANPDKIRRTFLKHRYGVTESQWNEMIRRQGNACAICGTAFSEGRGKHRPNLDHCHETGKVRGILCIGCNAGVGFFKDDPALLVSAALWLMSFDTNGS